MNSSDVLYNAYKAIFMLEPNTYKVDVKENGTIRALEITIESIKK